MKNLLTCHAFVVEYLQFDYKLSQAWFVVDGVLLQDMLTLTPRNLIQTASQLQDEQNRILEEAKLKAEKKREEVKATFKSTFARKASSESATNISDSGSEDMNSDTSVNSSTQTETRAKQNQKNGEASDSSTINTSMPLVEALRKHFEQN